MIHKDPSWGTVYGWKPDPSDSSGIQLCSAFLLPPWPFWPPSSFSPWFRSCAWWQTGRTAAFALPAGGSLWGKGWQQHHHWRRSCHSNRLLPSFQRGIPPSPGPVKRDLFYGLPPPIIVLWKISVETGLEMAARVRRSHFWIILPCEMLPPPPPPEEIGTPVCSVEV